MTGEPGTRQAPSTPDTEGAELIGRAQAPGLLLLHDLRTLYLRAQEADLAWTILVQVAKQRETLNSESRTRLQVVVIG